MEDASPLHPNQAELNELALLYHEWTQVAGMDPRNMGRDKYFRLQALAAKYGVELPSRLQDDLTVDPPEGVQDPILEPGDLEPEDPEQRTDVRELLRRLLA